MKLLLLVPIGLFAGLSFAQDPGGAATRDQWSNLRSLPASTTLRVQTAAAKPLQGQISGVTDDAVVIRTKKGEQTLLRSSVISITVKGKDHRARHILLGLAIGAGIGFSAGEVWDLAHPCNHDEFCILTAPAGKEILGPAGLIIGTIVGAALPGSSWQVIYRQ